MRNMLVIEATYLDEEAEMAKQFSHLTARMGAELGDQAGCQKLIPTISPGVIARRSAGERSPFFPMYP